MATFNSCVLVGRLTKDPEVKTTNSGKTVCPFTVAVDKGYGREGTNFIDCEAWGKTAEFISKYMKKGGQILVDGRLDQQVWETDGQKRSKIQVVVNSVESLGNKSSGQTEENQPISQTEVIEQAEQVNLSDIPFN